MPTRPPLTVPSSLDLRDVPATEARTRAFAGMFKVRPGGKIAMLVNHAAVEGEILKWAEEIGHRYLRTTRVEDNGHSHASLEFIKLDARR